MPIHDYDDSKPRVERWRKCQDGDHSDCNPQKCPSAANAFAEAELVAENRAIVDLAESTGKDPLDYLTADDISAARDFTGEVDFLHKMRAKIFMDDVDQGVSW